MQVVKGKMVALGYGKYFRSDTIVGLKPVVEDRGPGRRTFVYIEGQAEPTVASRSETAVLSDMIVVSDEAAQAQQQRRLLADILDTIGDIDPMLRSIIRDQGNWNLDQLEKQILDTLTIGNK